MLKVACLLISSLLLVSTGCGGGDGGECGDVITCSLSDLSQDQQNAYCSTLLAATGDTPGTRYECADTGLYLEVNTQTACENTNYADGCPVTGGELIDCYKAAKVNACAAFSDSGACAMVFENASSCVQ